MGFEGDFEIFGSFLPGGPGVSGVAAGVSAVPADKKMGWES